MLIRLVVLGGLVALLLAEAGRAEPPTLVEVGRIGDQPTARWTLPKGVHASQVCFARASDGVRASHASCYGNIYPTYFAPKTERLTAGSYDVFVDSSHGRSNTLRLVIPAFGPAISGVSALRVERTYRRAGLKLDVCGMPDGYSVPMEPVGVVVAQTRFRSGKLVAGRTTKHELGFEIPEIWESWGGGCGQLNVQWDVPRALGKQGDRYRVALTLITLDGAASRKVVREIRW
jgi:hypothetical protein